MIEWSDGYTARWKVVSVDPVTWEDGDEIPGIRSVTINRDATDDYPLLEQASLVIDWDILDPDLEDGYYRIKMVASDQFSVTEERHDVSTVLIESDSGYIDKRYVEATATGYSVLQPAKDRLMRKGDYAPKGSNGAEYARGLLIEGGVIAPIEVEGGFTLDDHIVFDSRWSYIRAVWAVLDAANWCMRISGRGVITISPKPDTPVLELDRLNGMRHIFPGISYDKSRSGIPNVYYAISGDSEAVAINDNPESRTSTVYRGREITEVDDSPVRIDNESLQQYAERMLSEMSTVVRKYSWTREYLEDAVPFDLIHINLYDFNIFGDFRILTQTIKCDKGISVNETIGLEESEY